LLSGLEPAELGFNWLLSLPLCLSQTTALNRGGGEERRKGQTDRQRKRKRKRKRTRKRNRKRERVNTALLVPIKVGILNIGN